MNDDEWWLSKVNIYFFIKYQVLPHWSLHFNLKVVLSLVCYNHCKKHLYELKILRNTSVKVYVTTLKPITPPTGFSSTSFWSTNKPQTCETIMSTESFTICRCKSVVSYAFICKYQCWTDNIEQCEFIHDWKEKKKKGRQCQYTVCQSCSVILWWLYSRLKPVTLSHLKILGLWLCNQLTATELVNDTYPNSSLGDQSPVYVRMKSPSFWTF